MFSRIVIVCAFGLIAALPSPPDDNCANWDDMIDDMVFAPVREQIRKAGKEYEPITDVEQHLWWHTGISMKNGTVGNLTSMALKTSTNPACLMCQSSNATHSNITIAMKVGLTDLAVTFENFLLQIPLLPNIGNTKTTILNSGNAVSASVSVLTTPTSDCEVNLNYFQILDLGTFRVQLEHGFWNTIYQRLFNVSSRLIRWSLQKFGVMSKLENQVSANIYTLASQQGPQVCKIIHDIFGGGSSNRFRGSR